MACSTKDYLGNDSISKKRLEQTNSRRGGWGEGMKKDPGRYGVSFGDDERTPELLCDGFTALRTPCLDTASTACWAIQITTPLL